MNIWEKIGVKPIQCETDENCYKCSSKNVCEKCSEGFTLDENNLCQKTIVCNVENCVSCSSDNVC